MNIKDYISTGKLEAYALGELSMTEMKEVENNLTKYPELRVELSQVEQTLEAFMMEAAVAPRKELKDRILARADDSKEVKVIPLNSTSSYWRWVAAASIVITLISSFLAYDYRDKWLKTTIAMNQIIDQNQQIAQNYNEVNLKLDKIEQDFAVIESASFTKVILNGTEQAPTAFASIYWNADSQETYLSIQSLKEISRDNQFQLWAIVEGKPVDMGVFDGQFSGLLKMKNIAAAQAFAITIEPRGGKESPTMETMQVIGTLAKG